MFAIVHVSLWDACVNSCICHLVAVLRIVPMCFPLKKNIPKPDVPGRVPTKKCRFKRQTAELCVGNLLINVVFMMSSISHTNYAVILLNVLIVWMFLGISYDYLSHGWGKCLIMNHAGINYKRLWNKTYRFCQLPACANHFFLRIC